MVDTTMEALTPRLSFERLLLAEVSLLISIELPNIPSPTTALPFRLPQFDTLPSSVTVQADLPTVHRSGQTQRSSLCRYVDSGVRHFLGSSPTGLAESSSQYSYGLFIRLWLLSTLSVENAVTIDYGAVTDSPDRTFT